MGNISDALEKAGVELFDQKREVPDSENSDSGSHSWDPVEEDRKIKPAPSGPWDERLNKIANDSGAAAESFRVLRSSILYPTGGREIPRAVLVTSLVPGEGKSTVAANLAIALARGVDHYSLLVDGDLRRPSLANLLGLQSVAKNGLVDFLRDEAVVEDLIWKTSVQKLSLLPSGAVPVNPAELLSSERMTTLINDLKGRYRDRFIILDSPPYQSAAETSVLAKAVDGIVIVVRYGKSDRRKIKEMIDTIGAEKVYGIVFNGMKGNYLNRKLFASNGAAAYGSYGGAKK